MTRSPCIKVCKLDQKTKLCLGCGRSLKEIEQWNNLDNTSKKNIIFRLKDKKNINLM